jgi:hypothetical protein
MKTSYIKGCLLGLVFLVSLITKVAYAATPMLYFSSQPSSTSLSGTTTLTYVVVNNVPQPMPLTSFSFTSSSDYTAVISNSCSSSGNAIVPVNGTCTISVALSAAQAGTTNSAHLIVGYSSQPGTKLVSNDITITTTDTGAVVFASQPSSPQAVTVGATTNLTYQVTNTTSSAQALSNLSFTASSRYTVGSIVVSGSSTCSSNIVPSTGTCTITVPLTGVSAGTSVGHLRADWGSTPTPMTGANFITINVSGSSVTPLAFVAPQPTSPQSVNTGASLDLDYKVTNPNASAVTITSIAFSSNNLYNPDQPSITVSGTGCTLTSVPPSSSTPFCTYTVHIIAGSSTGTASGQVLTVNYTGGSPLVSSPITVDVTSSSSTLFFTYQASSTSVNTNGSTTLTYQVRNPSASPVSFTSTFTTSGLFTVGTITNTCSGSVPAASTCNIVVPITAGSTGGVANNQNLTVDDSSTPIVSSDISIAVTGTQLLTFPTPVQGSWGTAINGTFSIPISVQNPTASPVSLTSLSFTSSSLYTVGTITVTGSGCSTSTINAGATCTVTVPFTANATPGSTTGQLIIAYTGGGPSVYTPPISIYVTNSGTSLSFVSPLPNAINMSTYMEQTLTYALQNNTSSNVPINSVSVSASTGTTTDTSVVNYLTYCQIPGTQGVVAANQTCYVVVTLTSNGTAGTIAQNLVINYGSSQTISSPINFNVATQASSRTLTFINQCTNQQVALGINPGTVNNAANINTSCNTASDCNEGASCVLTNSITGAKQCVWNAPVTADGNYQLTAAPSAGSNGGTESVTVPYQSTENAVIGGQIFNTGVTGRTGCTSSVGTLCSTADCSGGVFPPNGACQPGSGFLQPSATGEINLFLGSLPAPAPSTDTYDGSLINGFNVPFSITPSISNGRSTNPYACGIPGNPSTVVSTDGTLGACTWTFPWTGSDESYFTVITSPTATTCTGSCTTGVCGVSESAMSAAASGTSPQRYCGTFAGYWSAGQACSVNGNLGAPFNCATTAGGLPLSSWYLCNAGAAANSCYSGGATSQNCCGCQNWDSYVTATYPTGLPIPTAPTVTSCGGVASTAWVNNALGFAGVAKQACPSFYSYQYDDPSSTFNCGAASDGLSPHVGTLNTTDYTITFCPGGASGAPT